MNMSSFDPVVMNYYSSPQGRIFDDIRLIIVGNKKACKHLLSLRDEFDIPARGFEKMSEKINFEHRLENKKWDPEISNAAKQIQQIDIKEERDRQWQELKPKTPQGRFQTEIDAILNEAGLEPYQTNNVRFFVLCDQPPEDDLGWKPSSNHGVMYIESMDDVNYRVCYDAEGVKPVIYAPLTQDEKRKLIQDIDQCFETQFKERKSRAKKKLNTDRDVRILKLFHLGKSTLDIYDKIYGDQEIRVDKKKHEVIKNVIKRGTKKPGVTK